MKGFTLYAELWDKDESKVIMALDKREFESIDEAQAYALQEFSAKDWLTPTKPYLYIASGEDDWALTIIDELGALMDYYNPPGKGWTWYSICSGHSPRADGSYHRPDTECPRCMAGHWVNDEEQAADSKLHDEDYPAWYKKHNAPDSESRTFLKKIFPNLR